MKDKGECHFYFKNLILPLISILLASLTTFSVVARLLLLCSPNQCCICRVGESVGEGPEEIISATSAENVGICRQDLKKIQKQSFFSIF
jgi:hypothetical protein